MPGIITTFYRSYAALTPGLGIEDRIYIMLATATAAGLFCWHYLNTLRGIIRPPSTSPPSAT